MKKKRVVLAMSGGVDSSVAAALLIEQGYEVLGAFMRLGSPDGVEAAEDSCEPSARAHKQGCCSVSDASDARRVAGMLDIPFYVLNFQDEFSRVIDYFVEEYNQGRTPNPCVRCNDWLKFGRLRQYAEAVGADYVASGHYARIGIDATEGEPALMRGVDLTKDQSYVLFGMPRAEIARTLLPIGAMEKSQVREIARERGLPVFNKPDSQEICFVPDQDYAGLLKRKSPEQFKAGEFVTSDGRTVGTHEGHQHFTIGQRKGLGVALGKPVYVLDIHPESNRVTLGEKEALLKRGLVAGKVNVLSNRLGAGEVRCSAKIRYNHAPQLALATFQSGGQLTLRFDDPQAAITPGQAVVLYDGDVVLGGGWIERASD